MTPENERIEPKQKEYPDVDVTGDRSKVWCCKEQYCISSVQFSSIAQSCPTLCNPMNCRTPGLPVHPNARSSLRLMSIESVMPSSHLNLCRPFLLLPPIPPSIRVFSNDSPLHIDLYKTHLIRLYDLSHFPKVFHFFIFPLKFILKLRSEQLGNYCLWYS